MILEKIKTYAIIIDDCSYFIDEWRNMSNKTVLFSNTNPKIFSDVIHSSYEGESIEEVVKNIKKNIKTKKEEKKKITKEKSEAKKLMKRCLSIGKEIGKQGELLLRVISFDINRLIVCTEIISCVGWEHLKGRAHEVDPSIQVAYWIFILDNTWEHVDNGKGPQSLMLLDEDDITFERNS